MYKFMYKKGMLSLEKHPFLKQIIL